MTSKTIRLSKISASLAAAEGLQRSTSPRVAEVLQMLDAERVSGIPGVLGAHQQRVSTVNSDAELSPVGKRARVNAAADSTLGNLARLARRIVALEAEHRNATENAVQIPPADAAETLVDLALAQHLREARPIPTALLNASERVRLAAARLPIELSALKPEVHAAVRGSLIDPKLAVELGEESKALDFARQVTQSAIDELAPDAGWSPRQWVETFGGQGWRLPGVAPTMAERLAGEVADGSPSA